MRTHLWAIGLLLVVSCQSDQKAITLQASSRGAETAFATFSSAPNASEQIDLYLYEDSTFQLAFAAPKNSANRILQGKLVIAEDHYQLFFPDTVAQLNELITPVHPDASVVVYPDGSVALDKALAQFYVRGTLVANDTLAEKP